MQLHIKSDLGKYSDINSWGDITGECSYYLFDVISDNLSSLEIVGQDLEKIKLNSNQLDNLKNLLSEQKTKKSNLPNIQCFEFVNYVNGVDSFDSYKIEEISNINLINLGETLLICDIDTRKNNLHLLCNIYVKKPFFHFAISLGNGLFMSKFGKGAVYITIFEEMKKIYNYPKLYKLTA